MSSSPLPLRAALHGAEPYGAPQQPAAARLNVNENPYAPPRAVVDAIAERVRAAARDLNRYPDREALELRAALARHLAAESGVALPPERVWAANGSNEIMAQLFAAFGGPDRTALTFGPTYSMYPEYARDAATAFVEGSRRDDFTLDPAHAVDVIASAGPSLVLLASPNNPTGTALPLDAVEHVCRATFDGERASAVIVVDEAYGEFRREGTPSALELLDAYPHLAVTRTMSKAFAAAGLRLGYLAGSADLVDALRTVRLPYHLSAITQAAAIAALEHADVLLERVQDIRVRRDNLVVRLRDMGLAVADSDANFVMFGVFEDRHALWRGLLDDGVLIRETGPTGWLRATVGTAEETELFITALGRRLTHGT